MKPNFKLPLPIIIVIACVFSPEIFAQTSTFDQAYPLKEWTFNVVEFGLIAEGDHYGEISLEDILILAQNPEQMYRDLHGFEEVSKAEAYGGAMILNFGFSRFNPTKNREDREWRIGIAIHSPKESRLHYSNERMDTSIVYCSIQGEVTLDAAYWFKGLWGKRWHWNAGLGGNIGTSTGSEIRIVSGKYISPEQHPSEQQASITESYAGMSATYGRVFIEYGLVYGTKWQFGLNLRKGLGFQHIEQGNTNFIRQSQAWILVVRHKFR